MRTVKLSVAERVLNLKKKSLTNEHVSQYERAFTYCDLFMSKFTDLLDSGVSRSEIVVYLMMFANVDKRIASNTLCQKLKKIDYKVKDKDEDDVIPSDDFDYIKVKGEVSRASLENLSPATKPLPPKIIDKPIPDISASTQFNQDSSGFKGGIKIGNNFLGVDSVSRQQEVEIQRKSMENLNSITKQFGNPTN